MENVDKDVAAMLSSLKKYDKLNESVLGMVTLSMKAPVDEMFSYKVRGDGKPKDILGRRPAGSVANNGQAYKDSVISRKIADKKDKRDDNKAARGEPPGSPKKPHERMAQQYGIGGPKKGSHLPEGWDEDQAEEELEESGPAKHEIPAAFRKEKGGDWKTSKEDLEKDANKSPTTKKGLEDLKDKKDIKEEADPEVMEWMKRFAKLG